MVEISRRHRIDSDSLVCHSRCFCLLCGNYHCHLQGHTAEWNTASQKDHKSTWYDYTMLVVFSSTLLLAWCLSLFVYFSFDLTFDIVRSLCRLSGACAELGCCSTWYVCWTAFQFHGRLALTFFVNVDSFLALTGEKVSGMSFPFSQLMLLLSHKSHQPSGLTVT